MTPRPSEVWTFTSPTAPHGEMKRKHHLCIAVEGLFLFLSTHRIREQDHRGVLVIPNEAVPFLPPTETRRSEISCTTVIVRPFPDRTIPPQNPRGTVKRELMAELLSHVRRSRVLSEDEKDAVIEQLLGWYGTDLD